jgi:hypothetical protein
MRLNRFSLVIGIAFVLLSSTRVAFAQDEGVPAAECCLPLQFPIGARSVAMGQAITARGGRDGIFFNPAGLAALSDDQFVVHRSTMLDEAQLTTLALVIHSAVAGVFAVTYRLIDFGDTEVTDANNNVIGRDALIDQVLIASFATRITPGWTAGVSYKLYDFRTQCDGICPEQVKGTTHMLDVGTEFQLPNFPHLLLAASATHVGFPLQVKNRAQADPPPTRLRFGAAYEVGHHVQKDTTIQIWAQGDIVQRVRNATIPAWNVGAEAILNQTFFIRAGFSTEGDGTGNRGAGLGVGLVYQRYDISVAKTFQTGALDASSDPIHITFGVTF